MKVLRYRDLEPMKGIPWSRVHVNRLEEAGKFPRRVNLGGNSVGYIEAEIDDWIAERIAERDAAAALKEAERYARVVEEADAERDANA